MPNEFASKGQVFVCCACGKRSRDQYGDQALDGPSQRWDESCVLNCRLCWEDKVVVGESGLVTAVLPGGFCEVLRGE